MALENLLVRLIGEGSSYSNMLKRASAQTKMFQTQTMNIGRSVQEMGTRATAMGRQITMGLTLPLVGAGAAAIKSFADFDQAMTESTSIMKVTEAQGKRMRETALNLSGNVVQTPRDLAKAYFFLASAGLDAEQSMASLPRVAAFATAGAFDMATATDLLTDAQSALGLTVKDAEQNMLNMAHVSDVLVGANTLANATVQQFSEALTNDAGPSLRAFGKDIEEGVAVLAAYADQGIKGQVAGSQLARVTRLLSKAAIKNTEAHKKLGFSVFDANGNMRNYSDIIGQLEKITAGMSDETRAATLEQLGFQARVQNAILPLMGMSQQIAEYEAKLRTMGGVTDTVANKQMQSFSNQLRIIKNRATVLAIQIGEVLAPHVLKLLGFVSGLVQQFRELDPELQKIITTATLATAALGPMLMVTGKLLVTLGPLISVIISTAVAIIGFINPVVAAVVAVAALVAVARFLLGSWEDVGEVFMKVGQTMVNALTTAIRIQMRIWTVFAGFLKAQFHKIFTVDFLHAVIAGLKKGMDLMMKFNQFMLKAAISVFTGGGDRGFQDFINQVEGDLATGAQISSVDDALNAVRGIVGEEMGLAQQRQAAIGPILTEQQKAKVGENIAAAGAKVQQAREAGVDAMEDMKGLLTTLVKQGDEALQKEGIELAPLALSRAGGANP